MLKFIVHVYAALVSIATVVVFGCIVLTLGLLDLIGRKKRLEKGDWGPLSAFIKHWWATTMLALTGIRTKVSGPGLDSLRSQRGAIIVANHQSLLDIPAMFKHCPPNLSFIAKKELASIPIFGWAAFIVGTIFIDRAKGAQNESLSDIVRHLQSGLNIFIFPEGTRSTTGRLAPFKRGAFVFAIQAQAPIVPVTIINSRERLPKKTWKISPGEIEIVVHSPIATTGLSPDHRHDLSAKVHGVIAESLKSRIS